MPGKGFRQMAPSPHILPRLAQYISKPCIPYPLYHYVQALENREPCLYKRQKFLIKYYKVTALYAHPLKYRQERNVKTLCGICLADFQDKVTFSLKLAAQQIYTISINLIFQRHTVFSDYPVFKERHLEPLS